MRSGDDLIERDLTGAIIGAFYYVYNELGYGFLERIYTEALARTLIKRGFKIEREVRLPIFFEGERVGLQRIDMLVESRVILENKSTYSLSDSDFRQLRSYLVNSHIQVGLLLHFGPKPEFHRVVQTTKSRQNRSA